MHLAHDTDVIASFSTAFCYDIAVIVRFSAKFGGFWSPDRSGPHAREEHEACRHVPCQCARAELERPHTSRAKSTSRAVTRRANIRAGNELAALHISCRHAVCRADRANERLDGQQPPHVGRTALRARARARGARVVPSRTMPTWRDYSGIRARACAPHIHPPRQGGLAHVVCPAGQKFRREVLELDRLTVIVSRHEALDVENGRFHLPPRQHFSPGK